VFGTPHWRGSHAEEVAAWEVRRNQEQATIEGRFSIADAREKLRRLDPLPFVQ
jgi:hypothetical protein